MHKDHTGNVHNRYHILAAGILIFAFTGLSTYILKKQHYILDSMSETVQLHLAQSGKQIGKIENLLDVVIENSLLKRAQFVATLLSHYEIESILTGNNEKFIEASKDMAKAKEIHYVFFMNNKHNLITGYMDLESKTIFSYLTSDTPPASKEESLHKVFSVSQKDPNVLTYLHQVIHNDKPVGTIAVCVDKTLITNEVLGLKDKIFAQNIPQTTGNKKDNKVSMPKAPSTNGSKLSRENTPLQTHLYEPFEQIQTTIDDLKVTTIITAAVIAALYCLIIVVLLHTLLQRIVIKPILSTFQASEDSIKKPGVGKNKTLSPASDDLLPWSKKLELGLSTIDDQHKELVRIINSLHYSMKRESDPEEIKNILNQLSDYTEMHFSFEEMLFDKHNYVNTNIHKKFHRELILHVNAFKKCYGEDETKRPEELMDFLITWLKDHILKTDKAYVSFFKEKGER